jgi:mono/diheme cytochrome c family protein
LPRGTSDKLQTFAIFAAVHIRPPHPASTPVDPPRSKRGFPGGAARAFIAAAALSGVALADDGLKKDSAEFFEKFCSECHYEDASGGLDLSLLNYDPSNRDNLATWVRIFDRVADGEMPPKKRTKDRPAPADIAAFTKEVAHSVTAFEKEVTARDGRAMQRRLNRYEYENALRDLLNVPWAQVKDKLPYDGEAARFNKSGEALDVSFVQMERYLTAADYAMRQAMAAAFERPEKTVRKIYARDAIGFRYQPRENGTLPDRLMFPVLDSHAQPEVRAGRAPNTSPETREREAVGKVSSIFSDAGFYGWGYNAPIAGRYQIKLKGYSVWVSGGGIGRWFYEGQGAEKAPVYWLPVWHRPNADEVWPGRNNEPIGIYAQSAGQTRPVGVMDFTPKPTVGEIEVQLAGGERISTDAMRLFRTRVSGSDEQYVNPLATKEGMPGYAVQWLEITGPLEDKQSKSGYQLLFGDLPMRRLAAVEKGGVPVEVVAPYTVPAVGGPNGAAAFGFSVQGGLFRSPISNAMVEVVSTAPQQDAERLLRNFIKTSYRRPVEESEVQRFLGLFKREFDLGSGFARSMLTAYTGVLVSPGFVFVEEQPGKLDDRALATRLALFLWNSTPDATLRALADRGELHKPAVLRAQTERLLNDPKSRRFVDAFTDYWLDLRKIDDTSPSATIYNDYELDEPLKLASLEETQLFFADLVRENLPARNIVASDFTYLNERLANHYGIKGVAGANMRRVTLPKDSERGGLMTMASVLKLTANGTTTSPVLRGHWITERILGIETRPPPPSVKAVEPDIRGAVTIRQQLEKHRDNPTCASCHIKMDPPGFALESFDVMGAHRVRYRAVAENVKPEPGYGMNGQAFAFHYGLPVDSTGELPDGHAFADIKEFKRLVLKDEVTVARNLAKQLVVFATGAPVRFSDREELDRIMQRASARKYGVRTLVEEIVRSELFQTK